MNERIKELAEQATDKWVGGQFFDREKFAELIVRECAELTSKYEMGTTHLPDIIVSYNYSHKLEDVIKRHFGVEG